MLLCCVHTEYQKQSGSRMSEKVDCGELFCFFSVIYLSVESIIVIINVFEKEGEAVSA